MYPTEETLVCQVWVSCRRRDADGACLAAERYVSAQGRPAPGLSRTSRRQNRCNGYLSDFAVLRAGRFTACFAGPVNVAGALRQRRTIQAELDGVLIAERGQAARPQQAADRAGISPTRSATACYDR